MEITGFSAKPFEELGDFGACRQRLQIVEFAFQGFLGERGVEEIVAAAAEQRQRLPDLPAIEVAANPAVAVTGARDEMVNGQFTDLATAEFAALGFQGNKAGARK